MSAETPMPEITELILAAGGAELLRCMQCGTCTGVCPWPPRRRFSPRQVLRLAALGLSGYEADGVWTCVGCASCNLRCPRGIDVIEVLRSVRALLHESGGGPKSFRAPLASLRSQGNPWMGEREERGPFAAGLGLPRFSNSAETLLFFCCTQVWDPRNRRVAEALVAVLRRAGQALATLEPELGCCGDQARRVGAVELDQLLRQANRQLLQRHGVRRAVVSSPHCLQALRLDAPGGVGEELLAVRHHTQLLQELLARGALAPALPVPVRAVFHDPCYLGRHAGEYEAPRAVLRAIPGLELGEMPRNRQRSLCCGGGGGGAWREVPLDERFAVARVHEALAAGASVLATACPWCTAMLADAVKVLDCAESIEVMDVVEILVRSLGAEPEPVGSGVAGR